MVNKLKFLTIMMLVLSAIKVSAYNEGDETMKAINITKEDFINKVMDYKTNPTEWKYKGDKPAIIDFYASWCGPCRMLAPILDEIAAEYEGEIYVYKVDTEKETELAQLFNIRSIPTMLFIPLEEAPRMMQGALPKNELQKIIQEVLKVEK